MPKLTKPAIDRLKKSDEKDVYLFDSTLPGFGVRKLKRSGRVAFIVQYRAARAGLKRRVTIGQYGPMTLEQARSRAIELLAEVDPLKEIDPIEERKRRNVTVAALCDRYLSEYAEPRKKPRSVREDRRLLEKHVLPALGRSRIGGVKRAQVERLHNSLRSTPVQANRVLAVLSTAFKRAEEWDLIRPNASPCRGIRFFPEESRERFLSSSELARLADALDKVEAEGRAMLESDPATRLRLAAVAAIRLIVFTGCRRGEILSLRWEFIDLDRCTLDLPDTKTGQRRVPLNAPGREILEGLGPERSGWVFPGRVADRPLEDIRKTWDRVRSAAGLENVRIHDLRHTFASVAVGAKVGLYLTQGLLGHRRHETTQKYAHFGEDPLREATELVGERLDAAMKRKPDAPVFAIR